MNEGGKRTRHQDRRVLQRALQALQHEESGLRTWVAVGTGPRSKSSTGDKCEIDLSELPRRISSSDIHTVQAGRNWRKETRKVAKGTKQIVKELILFFFFLKENCASGRF